MSDESTDLLRLARENYGWIGVAFTIGTLLFKGVRSRLVSWWRKPSKRDIALRLANEASALSTETSRKVAEAVDNMSAATNRVASSLESGMREMTKSLHDLTTAQTIHAAATEIVMGESISARWTCDENGKCVFANHRLQKLFDLSEGEMKAFGWMSRIPAEHRKRVKESFERIYREKQNSGYGYEEHYPVEQPDGTYINVRARAEKIVYDPTGEKVLAVYGVCEPVPLIRRQAA